MTKFVRLVFAITIATTLHFTANSQSVSINTTGATADPSAILDVTSNSKGVLVTRMTKAEKNAIATPANGLLVYQTGPDSIGFHYYDLPNTQWVYINTNGFATDTTAWKLTGNSNVADTSFLGSINNKAVKFRVNNQPSGIIDSTTGDAALGYRALAAGHSSPGFYANNALGFEAGRSLNAGFANIAVGRHALASTGVSTQNIAIGDSAMAQAVSAHTNMGIGYQALKNYNGGGYLTYNTAIGYSSQSAASSTVGGGNSFYNTSIGGFAMADNRGGFDNTALGVSALRFNDSSSANTAIGINAMAYHKRNGFNSNVAVGAFALEADSIGVWNTVVGSEAMQNAKRGSVNVAVGFRSMKAHKDGGENTAVGVGSLEADSSGTQNTALGRSALFLNKAAARNTAVGAEAGVYNNYLQTNPLQGSENTYVGYNSGRTANVGRKNAVLGAYALEGSGLYGDQPTLDAYSRNSVVGDSAALRTFGNDNVALGFKALNTNAGGSRHVAIGSRALAKTIAGYPNTAVGYSSQDSTTTGFANTSMGSFALMTNKVGYNNTAMGNAAMMEAFNGLGTNYLFDNTAIGNDALRLGRYYGQTAIGSGALRNDTAGVFNTAVGYLAMYENKTGTVNTAIGTSALRNDTSGSGNTAVGVNSLYSHRTGNNNVAVGYNTLFDDVDGGANTAIGNYAMFNHKTNGVNTAVGYESMYFDTAGAYNTAMGWRSLRYVQKGNENVALGVGAIEFSDSSWYNTAVGRYSMFAIGGTENTALGYRSLGAGIGIPTTNYYVQRATAIGSWAGYRNKADENTFVGYSSGLGGSLSTDSLSGIENTGLGSYTLRNTTSGYSNTALGIGALFLNTSGKSNVAVGVRALLSNTSGFNNNAIGDSAMYNNSIGNSNSAVGDYALYSNTTGSQNAVLGQGAMAGSITGNTNVSIGAGSMDGRTRGNDNVAAGFWAGRSDSIANGSVYIGRDAGYNNQRDYTVAIGYQALFNNSNGAAPANAVDNTAIGTQALRDNTSGNYNVAIGNYSQFQSTSTGGFNTSIGAYTLFDPTTGTGNTVVGSNALPSNTTASANTALGTNAMFNTTTGGNNTGIGYQSLFANNSGTRNTAVGRHAGRTNTTGNRITVLGDSADVASVNLDNATAIGYRALAGASNSMVLGGINGINSATATTSVGIGTTTPGARLHVRRNGASGGTFIANPSLIIEDNTQSYVQLSNPTASENGILSGNAISTIRSGIVFGVDSSIFLRAGGNTNRMIIDNNGYVGIGTTAVYPLTQLHLYEPLSANVNLRVGSANTSFEPGLQLVKTGIGSDWQIRTAASGFLVYARSTDDFLTTTTDHYQMSTGAFIPSITNASSLGSSTNLWTSVWATSGVVSTSDEKFKENITNLNYGLNEIMKLRPVTYNWKENPQWGKKIGFIAQEVQPVLGEVVQVGELKSKTPSKDTDGTITNAAASDKLGIYYSDIIPVTVKAIQEQQQLILKQQKTIDELLKRIEKLEQK